MFAAIASHVVTNSRNFKRSVYYCPLLSMARNTRKILLTATTEVKPVALIYIDNDFLIM